jgi:NAD(P)-dependent dehydrogenase (short-subunit alcohol dehydrogenase family)
MMKGGVDVFTRNLALELGPRGITVNSIAPGAVFGGSTMPDTPEMRAFATGLLRWAGSQPGGYWGHCSFSM